MILHLLGLPHTITREEYSHCAYTSKVLRFSPMMRAQGFQVIHYGVGGMHSGANEDVVVLTEAEQREQIGRRYDPASPKFADTYANTDHPVYRLFNERLARLLEARVEPGDIVCLPFGHGHFAGTRSHRGLNVETGVGYTACVEPYRVYESHAWMHWHLGKEQRNGSDYEWVIPNYFDVGAWEFQPQPGQYLLYFGRIQQMKGLDIVVEIARHRPDLTVILCGQGSPGPFLAARNIEYRPPIFDRARSDLLGNALAVLTPTRYVEPFGGVAVEAQLCGTPALASAFGGLVETIDDGISGFHCRTLGDWLAALERVPDLDRQVIRERAAARYSLEAIGPRYSEVFAQLDDLRGEGWYSRRSFIGPVTKAVAKGRSLLEAPVLVESLSTRPRILFYTDTEWALGRIAHDLQRQLVDDFYIDVLDWRVPIDPVRLCQQYDLIYTLLQVALTSDHGLLARGVPASRIAAVAHTPTEVLHLERRNRLSGLDDLAGLAAISPNTVEAIRPHTQRDVVLTRCGVDPEVFRPAALKRDGLRVLGYAAVFSNEAANDGLDIKRGHLAVRIAEAVRLPFIPANHNYREMPSYYRGIDLLLSTSSIEGGPYAPLEAAASAIPTVGTATGILPELLGGGGGICLPVEEETFVAGAIEYIEQLIAEPALYQNAASAAYANATENWSWERRSIAWRDFFLSALEEAAQPA